MVQSMAKECITTSAGSGGLNTRSESTKGTKKMSVSRVAMAAASFAALLYPAIASAKSSADQSQQPAVSAQAKQLVADALEAELSGNTAKRRVLLSAAVDAAPDFQPARWHSGQIRAGGEWLPVDQAQQAAAADPKRGEYDALRKSAGNSPNGQLALARWCRKHAFNDEAAFHWRSVLSQNPQNEEALRALGVRWFYGSLMTPDEIQTAKDSLRKSRTKAKAFEPTVAKWERMLAAGDLASRKAALDEIRQIRDAEALPAIEAITLDRALATNEEFERSLAMGQALVAALDKTATPAATQSLLRHAVFAQIKSVREASIAALKQRPLHDYAPALLSILAMPVESSYRVVSDADGSVHYFHSLYREGPLSDWSFEGRRSAMQIDLQGSTLLNIDNQITGEQSQELHGAANNPLLRAEMAAVAQVNQQRFGSQAMSAQAQIAAANAATQAVNALVIPVLAATTGEDFGDNPRAWWDWWFDYNEVARDGARPVDEQRFADSTHRYYRAPSEKTVTVRPVADEMRPDNEPKLPYMQSGRRQVQYPRIALPQSSFPECFAAGTPVWTRTGLRPIESLDIGDFVLAQDAATGELKYKPVLGRTVRKPTVCRKLSIGKDTIVAVDGHPFWVVGSGWRMVKELEVGATLHTLNGSTTLASRENAESVETFNLIVADFNTYFVGESGVLVHDITPRRASTGKLPGLIAAQPAKLVAERSLPTQ
jgi:hypothetical protein